MSIIRQRASYLKQNPRYLFQGIAEGKPWQDSEGRWWISFTEITGVDFGAVPLDDVLILGRFTTTEAQDLANRISKGGKA